MISIGPILAVPGIASAISGIGAPVVAVSPLVAGGLKGPTAAFMRWAGHPRTSDGMRGCYGGLLDGLVADDPTDAARPANRRADGHDGPAAVAEATLEFALALVPQKTG